MKLALILGAALLLLPFIIKFCIAYLAYVDFILRLPFIVQLKLFSRKAPKQQQTKRPIGFACPQSEDEMIPLPTATKKEAAK